LQASSDVVAFLFSYLYLSHKTQYRPRHFVPIYCILVAYYLTTQIQLHILHPLIVTHIPPRLTLSKHSSYDLNPTKQLFKTPRYQPHNLPSSPPTATTMFLKQTAYKPRSGSQSSQGGSGGQQAENKSASPPPKAEATPRKSTDVVPGAISAAAAGRRRVCLVFLLICCVLHDPLLTHDMMI
jgi:hypothetical protein